MSLTLETYHDDEELRRYVLGLLPDAATERLDEASVADDEVAARLRCIETDLLDSYARGELAGSTLERFETYYLSSPLRRQRMEVAARFVRALDRTVTHDEPATWVQRIPAATTIARYSAAATLLILVSGMVLFQATQPRNEISLVKQEQPSPQHGPAVVGQPSTGSAPAPAARPRPPQGRTIAIALVPPTRSVASVPSLTVPSDAERVRFDLLLESNDLSHYRVGLTDPATNQVVWRSDWITPSGAEPASVSVVVPAMLLKSQHYALDLTGRLDVGRAEVIGSYPVRIDKP